MSFSVELKVPADVAFSDLVERVTDDTARRASLDAQRCDAVAEAARLGFITIVEQAMCEGREAVRLVATVTAAHLRVSLFERGLPLDDAVARREPRWSEIAGDVDEAHWHAHGMAGSELRLLVARPHAHAGGERRAPLEPEAETDVPLAPEQTYTIRRFEADDAAGVARAFYLAYGYHYDLPAVYVPERLIELNRSEHYVSIVALDNQGEVVGHYALAREGDEPIADGCAAIVLPAHRGRNLLNLLRRAAEKEAEAMGLEAYYSEPVTDHGRTQHASESFGAKACGVTLGEAPSAFVAKHMELSQTTQRQSCMLYMKPLRPRAKRTIYVPKRHREIVSKVYEQLGLPVDIRDGAPAPGRGALHTIVSRADNIGTIVIDETGTDVGAMARQAADDMRALRKLGAMYVTLPLEDPGMPSLCEAMESWGFFFSAVAPWMGGEGKDALRLQLPLTPIDLDALTVVGVFGKELLRYIADERERCSAVAS